MADARVGRKIPEKLAALDEATIRTCLTGQAIGTSEDTQGQLGIVPLGHRYQAEQ